MTRRPVARRMAWRSIICDPEAPIPPGWAKIITEEWDNPDITYHRIIDQEGQRELARVGDGDLRVGWIRCGFAYLALQRGDDRRRIIRRIQEFEQVTASEARRVLALAMDALERWRPNE